MVSKWVTTSAAVVLTFGFASLAQATPKELTGVDASGNTIDSGWSYDVSSAQASLVNLVFIKSSNGQFFFQKDAELTLSDAPLVIQFTKTGGSNAKTLVISDESVLNNTGKDWNGFRMELSSGTTGNSPNFAFTTSDGSSGIGNFKIDPFTSFTFYNNNAGLLLNGGTVKAGSTWFPGSQSTTGLAIMANASTCDTFALKEIPIAGTAVAIPLPAAMLSGLSTLLGLGLVSFAKRVRKTA